MKTVSYQKELPVRARYDVVICGGGPAGIGAAMAAKAGCAVQDIDRAALTETVRRAGSAV